MLHKLAWLLVVEVMFLHLTGSGRGQALGEETRRPRVSAATNPSPTEQNAENAAPTMRETSFGHTGTEIAFSCSVLVFGLALVGAVSFLAIRGKLSEASAFKLIGLTVVVTAAVFVIPAGFSQNQMTPLMGLLGAVAGYLLGKENEKKEP